VNLTEREWNCETCELKEESDHCSAESAAGMEASSVGKLFGVNESTVRYIECRTEHQGVCCSEFRWDC